MTTRQITSNSYIDISYCDFCGEESYRSDDPYCSENPYICVLCKKDVCKKCSKFYTFFEDRLRLCQECYDKLLCVTDVVLESKQLILENKQLLQSREELRVRINEFMNNLCSRLNIIPIKRDEDDD